MVCIIVEICIDMTASTFTSVCQILFLQLCTCSCIIPICRHFSLCVCMIFFNISLCMHMCVCVCLQMNTRNIFLFFSYNPLPSLPLCKRQILTCVQLKTNGSKMFALPTDLWWGWLPPCVGHETERNLNWHCRNQEITTHREMKKQIFKTLYNSFLMEPHVFYGSIDF